MTVTLTFKKFTSKPECGVVMEPIDQIEETRRHEDEDCKGCLEPWDCDCTCATCTESRKKYHASAEYREYLLGILMFDPRD